MSLQIHEGNKNIFSELDPQDNKVSSFKTSYDESLNKISARNKISTNIETVKTELESKMNTKLDELKIEIKADNTTKFDPLNMKLSYFALDKPYYSCDQPYYDLIQWPLLYSPEKSSYASKFTKHLSSITLEGDTLIQIQKSWDAIFSDFFQSL